MASASDDGDECGAMDVSSHTALCSRVVTTRSMKTSSRDAGTARRLATRTPASRQARRKPGRTRRRPLPSRHPHVQRARRTLCTSRTAGSPRTTWAAISCGSASTSSRSSGKAALQRVRLVEGQDAALAHQRDARAALGFVEVGRGHDDRDALRQELGEQAPEFAARHRVDAGGRLVEQDDLRLVDQRARQRELLLHAARQAVGEPRAERRQLHHLEQPVAALAVVARRRGSRRRTRCSRRCVRSP